MKNMQRLAGQDVDEEKEDEEEDEEDEDFVTVEAMVNNLEKQASDQAAMIKELRQAHESTLETKKEAINQFEGMSAEDFEKHSAERLRKFEEGVENVKQEEMEWIRGNKMIEQQYTKELTNNEIAKVVDSMINEITEEAIRGVWVERKQLFKHTAKVGWEGA